MEISRQNNLYQKSIFGMVSTYNDLPADIVDRQTVPEFQSALAAIVKAQCPNGKPNWRYHFSNRRDLISIGV